MEAVASWLMDQLSLDSMQSTTVVKLLQTVAILIGLNVARWLTLRVVFRQTEDVRVRYTWRKGIGYVSALLGALLLRGSGGAPTRAPHRPPRRARILVA